MYKGQTVLVIREPSLVKSKALIVNYSLNESMNNFIAK